MRLMSTEIENEIREMGIEMVDRKNDDRDEYRICNWWRLKYKYVKMSVYYDPADLLGYVGRPYYELYDGNETYRYLEDSDDHTEFIGKLKEVIDLHNADIDEHPENWL